MRAFSVGGNELFITLVTKALAPPKAKEGVLCAPDRVERGNLPKCFPLSMFLFVVMCLYLFDSYSRVRNYQA